MNPISGTFRIGQSGPLGLKSRLLDFLADEKEIYELFMVVDEELKMMCDICNEGGQVLGPFLKPMTHLVHTEYLLAGRTSRDVREVLRDTMYAATVTGSPVENACRLIKQLRVGGPWLLRRRARAARPRPRRRADRRQPDRHPHRRRRPGRPAQGHRRRHAGPRLATRRTRSPRRTPRPAASCPRSAWSRRRRLAGPGRRRPDPRRGRPDRAELAQPEAEHVLADRPGRLAA